MRIFIEPTEPLLFRTGRPFDAGESNFAESIFPPTPETLQGALRAMIATHWNHKLSLAQAFNDPSLTSLIGDRNGYGRFRITGMALGQYNLKTPEKVERLFPPPAHIMQDEESTFRLIPQAIEETQMRCNLPLGIRHLLWPEKKKTKGKLKPLRGWLTETNLKKALNASEDLATLKTVRDDEIFQYEPRLGIAMNSAKKTTEEGFLYQMQMIRMQPHYGFVVDIHLSTTDTNATTPINETWLDDSEIQSLLHLPQEGRMTLGGEQRAAHFRVLETVTESSIKKSQSSRLLYLATPAYFSKGWKPSAPFDTPITAAINRYELIGGWKLNPGNAGGESKQTRRCAPAGSVYFFQELAPVTQPLTEYGWQIGYGIAYTGEY